MKNLKRFLPILLCPLLMSNSPAFYDETYNENYYDFTINSITKDNNNDSFYTFNITNKGEFIIYEDSEFFLELNNTVDTIRAEVQSDFESIVVPNETKNLYVKISQLPENYEELKLEDVKDSFVSAFQYETYNHYELNSFERRFSQKENLTYITYNYVFDDYVRLIGYSVDYTYDYQPHYESHYINLAQEYLYDTYKNNFTFTLTIDGNILESEISDLTPYFYVSSVKPPEKEGLYPEEIAIITTLGVLTLTALTTFGLTIGLVVKKVKENKEEK